MALLHTTETGHDSQSLYRRYRPQVFQDVVGQEHVTHTLRNALKAQPPRVSHAYLFCGPRGTGKTTTARLLAKGLNCEAGPTPDPCCKCDMCQFIARGSAMDVLEIDAASNTGVDKVRDVIIEKVNYAPAEGRYRVYIIDEVHQLSLHAFNALLKTLEEPPPHVVFILATTETHKVPGTILSRCQRFDFKPISAKEVIARLQMVSGKEGLEVEPAALARIARAAEGSARDALSILEQASAYSDGSITELEVEAVLGSVSQELLFELTESIAQRDTAKSIMLIHTAINQGKDIQQLLVDLGGHLRDLLLLSLGCTVEELSIVPDEILEKMKQQAQRIGRGRLGAAIDVVCETEREMRVNSQHRLLSELALFKLTHESSTSAVDAQTAATAGRSAPTASVKEAPETPWSSALEQPTQPLLAKPKRAAPQVGIPPASAVTEQASVTGDADRVATTSEDQDLQGVWTQVLAKAKKRAVGLAAVLRDATPVALNADALTLEFANQFHHDNIAESSRKGTVREIVSEVIGRPVEIKCALRAGDQKATAETPPVATNDASGSVKEGHIQHGSGDLVQAAISLFDATIVEKDVRGE